mgnify:CR=1 FL=1
MDGAPRMVSTDKETVGELLEDLADTIDTEFYLEDAKESDPIEAMMNTFSDIRHRKKQSQPQKRLLTKQ